MKTKYLCILIVILSLSGCQHQENNKLRKSIALNNDWLSIASDSLPTKYNGFEKENFPIENWTPVTIPHNWDDYGGYRRLRHGNRHGYAWYRKNFKIKSQGEGKRYFLFFEGVGSYATIWLNGDSVGYHAGGRTTFTIDITNAIQFDKPNVLAVRADHPAEIRDLPWVCGGCSPEWGFCEGSQPMGIFRPVHLMVTNDVRIVPFGIHVWNDKNINEEKAKLNIAVKVKNYDTDQTHPYQINYAVHSPENKIVAEKTEALFIEKGLTASSLINIEIQSPKLWSLQHPNLYKVVVNVLDQKGKIVDSDTVKYGIRTINWDILHENSSNRFYLNNEPVFINGTAEYEHIFGQSHAFYNEQVKTRTEQFKAMGYNSFRDGHQPHNMRYHKVWDEEGILWWPQMSAHIWFDTPEFRKNFKKLLSDWVIERRNSPSIILWGLENESTLPEDFAKECTELIRKLDPTASSQRLVTTCNGGSGTDWNVVQNWSGTYGGDPENYANELADQLMNGEYGAWRSIDLHTEGDFNPNGILSEDRFNLLMESKIRLGEKAKKNCCGQYHWLLASHDNPGRTQSGEGLRDIDRVGPVNYKGAFTIWGEPTDMFYMARSNYADKNTEPMVYITSHTWPDRWTSPGIKNGIRVFTNCEEVRLYNDLNNTPIATKKRGPIGTHIVFNNIEVQCNVLRAEGYVDGKKVAEDLILQHHLPKCEKLETLAGKTKPLTAPNKNYLYLINCGGDNYIDAEGNEWLCDVPYSDENHYGTKSWTDDYKKLPSVYGSQRETTAPIKGSVDWKLLQSFRYGRHKLKFYFPVQNGDYKVELYFIEPWYGVGGGLNCTDWRIFDVAINGDIVIDDLDIWKEVGVNSLLKKTAKVHVENNQLEISFPQIKSGQAVLSAIAISTNDESKQKVKTPAQLLSTNDGKVKYWTNTGDLLFSNHNSAFVSLLPELYGTERLQFNLQESNQFIYFHLNKTADVYLAIPENTEPPHVSDSFTLLDAKFKTTFNGNTTFKVYKKKLEPNEYDFPHPSLDYPLLVFAKSIDNLDDPIDLRKATTWQAEDGTWSGSAKVTKHLKKDVVMTPNQHGTISMKFEVGLASKYGLQFRFINLSGDNLDASIKIISKDGRLMWQGEWTFPTTPNKWKSYRNDTQTVINAGTYFIQITPKSKGPLYFDWVKVQ